MFFGVLFLLIRLLIMILSAVLSFFFSFVIELLENVLDGVDEPLAASHRETTSLGRFSSSTRLGGASTGSSGAEARTSSAGARIADKTGFCCASANLLGLVAVAGEVAKLPAVVALDLGR